ncbi:MAG: hypothetical protein HQK49_07030 [Oligoflexia bacterium]|nr:hypothetical protein [Oligoflexia bacterium]
MLSDESEKVAMISFSILDDYPSKLEAITAVLKDNLSNSFIKKWKDDIPNLNKRVQRRDQISLPIDFVNRNMVNPQFVCVSTLSTPRIIAEDENFLIINKPPNVHGHPLSYSEKDNILSFLRDKYPYQWGNCLQSVNETKHERGLLYRLDYETSGVLIYVKNDQLYQYLRENYSKVVTQKIYIAIVRGHFDRPGVHRHTLKPTGKNGHKMVASATATSTPTAAQASLNVSILEYNQEKDLSLLKIELHTGIRHQIRVQLRALGYPILGDNLYGSSGPSPDPSVSRLFLHALTYKILLNEREYVYKSETTDALAFDHYFRF